MLRIGDILLVALSLTVLLATPAFSLTLTVDVSGMDGYDRVVSDPPGIDCSASSGSCAASFGAGAYVALAAIPRNGTNWTSNFWEWSGACSGTSEACVVLMNTNKTVSANFVALGIPVAMVTVTVTLNGNGTIISNPEGILCSGNTCSGDFPSSTTVALQAIPDPPPEGYSSFFVEWSGDCTGEGPCPLYLDSSKNVTAQFGMLAPPAFAVPAPVGQSSFRYDPVPEPVVNFQPADNRPMAIGDVQDAVALHVELPVYSEAVDVYVGILIPGWTDLVLVGPGNTLSLLGDGLIAWKEDVLFAGVDEPIFGQIDISTIPEGLYRLYVMVTPANSLASYNFWATYFETTSPDNLFLP